MLPKGFDSKYKLFIIKTLLIISGKNLKNMDFNIFQASSPALKAYSGEVKLKIE